MAEQKFSEKLLYIAMQCIVQLMHAGSAITQYAAELSAAVLMQSGRPTSKMLFGV